MSELVSDRRGARRLWNFVRSGDSAFPADTIDAGKPKFPGTLLHATVQLRTLRTNTAHASNEGRLHVDDAVGLVQKGRTDAPDL